MTLESIPLFQRGASIVCSTDDLTTSITGDTIRNLRFVVACLGQSSFALYEDDGVSNAYQAVEAPERSLTSLTVVPRGEQIHICIDKESTYASTATSYRLEIISPEGKGALFVSLDGSPLVQYINVDDLNSSRSTQGGWSFDAATSSVLVQIEVAAMGKHRYELVISFEPFDLIGMEEEEEEVGGEEGPNQKRQKVAQ